LLFTFASVLDWIVLLGLAGFFLMGFDKLKSRLRKGRLSEKSLWITSLAGGFLGVIAGAVVFHHKVAKPSFWPPVVAAAAIWLVLIWLTI
jgi:uncharacterized membrane protein YsdA (DUF1294 family)